MLWPDDGEVAPVQGGHVGQLQPFRDGDDRCVDGAQRQVSLSAHEFGHAGYVGCGGGDMLELACRDRFEEGSLDVGAFFHQPAHLDDDCGGDQQRALGRFQQCGATVVMVVGAVDRRDGPVSSRRVTRGASGARG